MAQRSQIWHAPPSDQLLIEPLDGLTLVYHRESGQTHLLAEPLPQLLEMLSHGPASAEGLTDRLTRRFDLADPETAQQRVHDCLDQLAKLGLVCLT